MTTAEIISYDAFRDLDILPMSMHVYESGIAKTNLYKQYIPLLKVEDQM